MKKNTTQIQLIEKAGCWLGEFLAMGSPCHILIDTPDQELAHKFMNPIAQDAWRIEKAYSRYRDDNIVYQINNSNGEPVKVDEEAARLLDFADELFEISNGMFDITSGVLRKAWNFDGSDTIPSQTDIDTLLSFIGWQKVRWDEPYITLPAGMQIDFGGIGKEYSVDRAAGIAVTETEDAFLINYGGDMFVSGPRRDGQPWRTGIEDPFQLGQAAGVLDVYRGALATSGDARRFLYKDGIRYSHVLNPKTGWPVQDAPHSVTVAAPTCVEAGMLSTLSLLQGANAESFLEEQGVQYWCVR